MYNFDKPLNRFNTNSYKWNVKDNELPMWVADMDFPTVPEVIDSITSKASIGAYGYSTTPSEYFQSYIDFWKKRHNFEYKREWMMFSIGVVASISSIVRRLTNVAENVLLCAPVYNCFYTSILDNGRRLVSSDLVYKDGKYEIDFNDLESKMKDPQTSLMILCNPHNPTGNIWTKEELAKIGHLAKENNVVILSDEIHCDLMDPGYEYTPFASVNEECLMNSITTIAPSKCFNLAGLQSSVIIAPNPKLWAKVNRGIRTDEISEGNYFSYEPTIAAFKYGEEWLNELNAYIYENKKYFYNFIKEEIPELHVIEAHSTYLLWVDCSKITDDTTSMCAFIREKTGLFVNVGETYGKCGKTFFRINLATQKANVIDGCNRLKQGIELYKQKK